MPTPHPSIPQAYDCTPPPTRKARSIRTCAVRQSARQNECRARGTCVSHASWSGPVQVLMDESATCNWCVVSGQGFNPAQPVPSCLPHMSVREARSSYCHLTSPSVACRQISKGRSSQTNSHNGHCATNAMTRSQGPACYQQYRVPSRTIQQYTTNLRSGARTGRITSAAHGSTR